MGKQNRFLRIQCTVAKVSSLEVVSDCRQKMKRSQEARVKDALQIFSEPGRSRKQKSQTARKPA